MYKLIWIILFRNFEIFHVWNSIMVAAESVIRVERTGDLSSVDEFCDNDMEWHFFEDKCYFISKETMKMKDADNYCINKGAHLTSIHSDAENNFIYSKVKKHPGEYYYIGARILRTGEMIWTDGSSFLYENFFFQHVDCTVMVRRDQENKWASEPCDTKYHFICKMPSEHFYNETTMVSVAPKTKEPGECPTGWDRMENKCFKAFGYDDWNQKNWYAAKNFCIDSFGKNADLISLHSDLDKGRILVNVGYNWRHNLWIGMKKEQNTFSWDDHSNGDWGFVREIHLGGQLIITHRVNDETCVELNGFYFNGELNDLDCHKKRGFICQQPLITDKSRYPKNKPEEPKCKGKYSSYYLYEEECFSFKTEPKTWKEAKESCAAEGAHLVSFRNKLETIFTWIKAYDIGIDEFYIGLKKEQNKSIYKWSDQWPVLFTNWDKNEPLSDTAEVCVKMNSQSGLWQSQFCEEKLPYVCKHSEELLPKKHEVIKGECPDERWVEFGTEFCYLFETKEQKNWADANNMCLLEGAHLASIHSQQENTMLGKSMGFNARNFYIGLFQQRIDFGWTDNTSYDFVGWNIGEPNSDHEECVEMYPHSGTWNDVPCSENKNYVCKIKKTQTKLLASHKNKMDIRLGMILGAIAVILLGFVGYFVFRMKRHSSTDNYPSFQYSNDTLVEND